MIDLDLVFRFVKGRCHGNQIILGEVMNVIHANQLCTTGVDQLSGKYIYVRQVVAWLWLCYARGRYCGAKRAIGKALPCISSRDYIASSLRFDGSYILIYRTLQCGPALHYSVDLQIRFR